MFCPDCGYNLTAFDKECPRCARLRARRKGCPHCGTAAPVDAPQCAKCGHVYRTAFAPTEAPGRDDAWTPPPAAAPPAAPSYPPAPAAPAQATFSPPPTPLNAAMLACRVCGNTAAQKVSAVCQSGAWSGGSSSLSVGAIHLRHGDIPMSAVTATRSSGASEIARLLMPPVRPRFVASWAGSILVAITGLVAVLIAASMGGPLWATTAAALAGLLWFFVLRAEGGTEATGQARHHAALAQWEHAMRIWDRLFYCSRCDHVYDPQDGVAAPPHGMPALLYAQAPPLLAAGAVRELPHRLTAERCGLIAGLSSASVIALIWGLAWATGQSQAATPSPPAAGLSSEQTPSPADTPVPAAASDANGFDRVPMEARPHDPYDAPPAYVPPAFTMRTKAGGGPPPDLSRFRH